MLHQTGQTHSVSTKTYRSLEYGFFFPILRFLLQNYLVSLKDLFFQENAFKKNKTFRRLFS